MSRQMIDLIGKRFEKLTVIKLMKQRDNGHLMWLCRCDCGKRKAFRGQDLRRGKATNCGCVKSIRLDLKGKRFGLLTVIKEAGRVNGQIVWSCRCDCGGTKKARSYDLRRGHTRSCGCLWGKRGRKRKLKRNEAVKTLYENGFTQVAIAEVFGMTRQRIEQILKNG